MTVGEYPSGQLPGTEKPACWLAVVPLATPSAPARLDIVGDGATSATCGPCTALFQGVLFDREELAKRLPGGCPEPRNDAALVIDAYRQWDEDFLSHINGVFSLVVWDASRNTLLIARDPVGTVGLYYTRTASDLVAAPTLTEVLDHPGVSREFNRYAVAEHLSHRWLRREETYFARIFRLPPGHVLRLRDGTQTIRKYRDRFPSTQRIDWATEQDLESFDDLFVRAVRRCLRGPAGINLSGGLDSVSIAAVAVEEARRMGLPVPRAFGIAFPDSLSEEDTQRSVAQRLGLPLTMMRLEEATGPRGLLLEALDLSGRSPTPLIALWGPAYTTLARVAKAQGCDVVLTGNGGDDWLTVTPWVAADLIRTGNVIGLYEFWRMWQRSYRQTYLRAARVMWDYGGAPLIRHTIAETINHISPSFVRNYRRRSSDRVMPPYVAPDAKFRQELIDRLLGQQVPPDAEGFYVRDVRRALTSAVSMTELEELWYRSRQTGVELAHPFWDLHLTELLARTPPHLLYKGGRSKSLVRAAVARRFPNLGFERQKKLGATPYFAEVVRREAPAAREALGGAPALISLEVIDRKALDMLIIANQRPTSTLDAFRMWYLLSVESWLQGHAVRSTSNVVKQAAEGGDEA